MIECVQMLEAASLALNGLSEADKLGPMMLAFSFACVVIATGSSFIKNDFIWRMSSIVVLVFLVVIAFYGNLFAVIAGDVNKDSRTIQMQIVGEVAKLINEETVYVGMESCLSKKGEARMYELSNLIGAAIITFARVRMALLLWFTSMFMLCFLRAFLPFRFSFMSSLVLAFLIGIQIFVYPVSLDIHEIRCNAFGLILFIIPFAVFASLIRNKRLQVFKN